MKTPSDRLQKINERINDLTLTALVLESRLTKAGEFREEDHPRAEDGRFGEKPGEHGGSQESDKKEKTEDKKESGSASTKEFQIKSKSGILLNISVSGTKENPKINVADFKAGGKTIGGPATIQHWKSQGVEEGLYFDRGGAYTQCAQEMPKIKEAISKLPSEETEARKVKEVVDVDGDKVVVSHWKFDKPAHWSDGVAIGEDALGRFLDSRGIKNITISDAEKLWNENHDLSERKKKDEESRKLAQQMQDEEDMDR
jgi:hypothetical protein